jgi:serine protease Do
MIRKTIVISLLSLFVVGQSNAQEDLSQLYEEVHRAVVTIYSTSKEIGTQDSQGRRGTATVEGLGSGFMISNKKIITAAHVVQVAENIAVEFKDKEKIPAKVLSIYKNADVALIELAYEKKDATIVPMGDSDAMKIGERIFVIGAPFGLKHSLSSGYLSGRLGDEKRVSNAFTSLEYFQTDAAINTGNSGGPMFNMSGEVVGIVSHILSKSGGFEGLGFAATSNVARDLLIDRNPFYLGIDGVAISGELAGIFNLPQYSGFLVQRVVFLSPAGMMGVKGGEYKGTIEGQEIILGGDIILAIDEIEFSPENLDSISQHFGSLEKGSSFSMKILRKGKVMVLNGTF